MKYEKIDSFELKKIQGGSNSWVENTVKGAGQLAARGMKSTAQAVRNLHKPWNKDIQ